MQAASGRGPAQGGTSGREGGKREGQPTCRAGERGRAGGKCGGGGAAHLPCGRPEVGHAPEGHLDEQIAAFDARAQQAAQLQHAVAAPQPPEHGRLVRHILAAVGHADAEERRAAQPSAEGNTAAARRVV